MSRRLRSTLIIPAAVNIPIDFGVNKMKGLNSALDIILPVKIYFPSRFKE